MEILAELRQRRFPRELRIEAVPWPPDPGAGGGPPETAAAGGAAHPEGIPALAGAPVLAALGTGLWRLRRSLAGWSGEPGPELRGARRHLDAAWDAAAEGGLDIRDHDGQVLPRGGIYELEVLAFQPTPGLGRETVLETVKPTIQAGGRRIQMGQVIVGAPAAGEAPAAGPAAGEESA